MPLQPKLYTADEAQKLFGKLRGYRDFSPTPQLWEMKEGRVAEGVFKSWGATEIYRYDAVTPTVRYMIRLAADNLWHYAHESDRANCYASIEEGWDVDTAAKAVTARKWYVQKNHLQHLRENLTKTEQVLKQLEADFEAGRMSPLAI